MTTDTAGGTRRSVSRGRREPARFANAAVPSFRPRGGWFLCGRSRRLSGEAWRLLRADARQTATEVPNPGLHLKWRPRPPRPDARNRRLHTLGWRTGADRAGPQVCGQRRGPSSLLAARFRSGAGRVGPSRPRAPLQVQTGISRPTERQVPRPGRWRFGCGGFRRVEHGAGAQFAGRRAPWPRNRAPLAIRASRHTPPFWKPPQPCTTGHSPPAPARRAPCRQLTAPQRPAHSIRPATG